MQWGLKIAWNISEMSNSKIVLVKLINKWKSNLEKEWKTNEAFFAKFLNNVSVSIRFFP